MKLEFSRRIFQKYSNIKFLKNLYNWSRVRTDGLTDRHDRHLVHAKLVLQTNQHKIHDTYNIKIDMRKLLVSFRKSMNASDNQSCTDLDRIINPVDWLTKHQGWQYLWNFMSILEVGSQYRSFHPFKKTVRCSKTYLTSTLNVKFWRRLHSKLSYVMLFTHQQMHFLLNLEKFKFILKYT